MAKTGDEDHFEDYRAQTKVKHAILSDYLPAYFTILKSTNKNLNYLDGFAGRGTYTRSATGETIDGSPLRALKLIAEKRDLAKHVTTIFIEASDELFELLEPTVLNFWKKHQNIREPLLLHGRFADKVDYVLEQVGGKLVPTFLFVDPCGVEGVAFEAIKRIMDCGSSEAFIFFNIDGVRRIAGLDECGQTLEELLGSRARAEALWNDFRATNDPISREELILSHYRQALNEAMGVKFTAPFRVEQAGRRQTSHFLIHATKHPLGFAIMKDVMWRQGATDEGRRGMEFHQASRTGIIPLFYPDADKIKQNVLDAITRGQQPVDLFYDEWVIRPNDMLCRTAYRAALLTLEAEGKIIVIDKDGKSPKPVNQRRPYKRQPTLGDGYYVRVPG